MAKLYLVRHGEAAAGWTEDPDPGLSVRGRDQAREMADALVDLLPSVPVLTSPMRRTRETADALASRWGVAAEVEAAVGEVPSPALTPLGERGGWLRRLMEARWSEAPADIQAWRDRVLGTLTAVQHDAVIVTHYIAINVAVGAADEDERVVCFRPGYCSVTVLETESGDAGSPSLRVLERGAQANTLVL